MQEYKTRFIDYLLKTGALKIGGNYYSLKSKRISPWFVNMGDFNDGESSTLLGEFYADLVAESGAEFDLLYGIPEKGNALVIATALALYKKGKNVPWFYTRKYPKDYGEATAKMTELRSSEAKDTNDLKTYGDIRNIRDFIAATQHLTQEERIKSWVIGRHPKNRQSIIQLDDVFTAGDAKYEACELLQFLGDFKLPLLAIAVDRQELSVDGNNAIEEYEQKTGTIVVSIVNASDIYSYLMKHAPITTPNGEITEKDVKKMHDYLSIYGTKSVKALL